MGSFLFAAMSLIVITLLLLLRPWQRRPDAHDASTREINAGVYAHQIAELDRDLASGTLARADHAQARDELQRRLLDDTSATEAATGVVARTRHTTLLIALALPLAAGGLYALLGEPEALLAPPIGATASPGAHPATAAEVEQMIAALAARLESEPSDTKGWAMLARSYRATGRIAEAQAAFARIGDALNQDPTLLAQYADLLATQADGNIEGRPLQLVNIALKLDPDHPMALSLAATAAYKRRDFSEAARHWQRLLLSLPPESEDAKWLKKTLAEIGAPVAAETRATAPDAPTSADDKSVSGIVTLAPKLQAGVRPDDTLFVFARPVDGRRAPLAVQRARAADLPLRFRLDDSMAMNPDHKLSGATEVRIEARLSRSGDAMPVAGDLLAAGAVVKPGARQLALEIDAVRR